MSPWAPKQNTKHDHSKGSKHLSTPTPPLHHPPAPSLLRRKTVHKTRPTARHQPQGMVNVPFCTHPQKKVLVKKTHTRNTYPAPTRRGFRGEKQSPLAPTNRRRMPHSLQTHNKMVRYPFPPPRTEVSRTDPHSPCPPPVPKSYDYGHG